MRTPVRTSRASPKRNHNERSIHENKQQEQQIRIGTVLSGLLSLGLLLPHSTLGQDIPPLIIVTNTGTLPTNAVEMPAPTPAPSPFPPVLPNSPAPTTNFPGLDDNNFTWPPDTDGCVGPSNVVTMLNTQVRIQDRSGNTISTTSLLSWWQSRISGLSVVFDPRILNDPYSQRWVATATANRYTGSAILIAVSTNSNPSGGCYAYGWDVDTSGYSWADFPTPGFNRDKIAISWNYFPIYVGGADGVGLFVLNKTNVYAGGSVTPQSFYQPYRSGTTTNGYNLRPAVTYDTNDATLYLLQDFQDNPTNSSLLALYTITGSAGSATLARSTNFPSAPAWASAGPNNGNIAPQLGQPDVPAINTVDSRLSQVVYRNGSLWCAHTIFLPANNPTRCAVQRRQWHEWQCSSEWAAGRFERRDDVCIPKHCGEPIRGRAHRLLPFWDESICQCQLFLTCAQRADGNARTGLSLQGGTVVVLEISLRFPRDKPWAITA